MSVQFESELNADRFTVWNTVATMDGVNAELAPVVRLTSPSGVNALASGSSAARGFRSWILVFGVLPIDRHTFAFDRIVDGEGFWERSHSWLNRAWHHDRTVTDGPNAGTCVLRDTVALEPRIRLVAPIMRPAIAAVFRHRHRRLRRRFGVPLTS